MRPCVRVCVRGGAGERGRAGMLAACVLASLRACVRACVLACLRACVRASEPECASTQVHVRVNVYVHAIHACIGLMEGWDGMDASGCMHGWMDGRTDGQKTYVCAGPCVRHAHVPV